MAPTRFSMMFSAMLIDAYQVCDAGSPIRYRFDGKLFNLKRLQSKSKVRTGVLDEPPLCRWPDKNAKSETKIQKGHGSYVTSMCQLWPHKSIQKDWGSTPPSTSVHKPWTINVNIQTLQIVNKFTYLILGSSLSRAVPIDDEVAARGQLFKASLA